MPPHPETDTVRVCAHPIFIIGSPRSGTTALAQALGQHSHLWTSHESYIVWTLFGHGHADRAFRMEQERQTPGWLRTQSVDKAEFLRSLGLGINALFTSRSEGRRWIDQTPLYTLMVDTLAQMFPGACFLHIVRDGRRVVHSMTHFLEMFEAHRREELSHRIAPWTTDFTAACQTWSRHVEIAMDFAARHPARCLTVSNEALADAPEEPLGRIFRFLNVPPEDAPARYLRSHRVNSSFRAGPAPSPARARPAEPWQEWTAEQRAIFAREAGSTLVKYGLATADELRAWQNGNTGKAAAALKASSRG